MHQDKLDQNLSPINQDAIPALLRAFVVSRRASCSPAMPDTSIWKNRLLVLPFSTVPHFCVDEVSR